MSEALSSSAAPAAAPPAEESPPAALTPEGAPLLELPPLGGEDQEVVVRRPGGYTSVGDLSVMARVVYLGANPQRTVRLRGTLDVSGDEEGQSVRWRPVGGMAATIYHFEAKDSKGRPLAHKTTRDGRIFEWVHNIDHLATFLELRTPEGQPEFEVRAVPPVREKIELYARLRRQRVMANQNEGPGLLALMDGGARP